VLRHFIVEKRVLFYYQVIVDAVRVKRGFHYPLTRNKILVDTVNLKVGTTILFQTTQLNHNTDN